MFGAMLLLRHFSASADGLVADPAEGQPILPPIVRLLPEAAILALVAMNWRRRSQLVPGWLKFGLVATLVVPLISLTVVVIRGEAIDGVYVLSALRSRLLWLGPLMLGLVALEDQDAPLLGKATILVGLLQVVLVFAQWQTVENPDYVTGLMGEYGSGILAIFQATASLYVLSSWVQGTAPTWVFIALTPILMVPIPLAEAMVGFYVLPVGWVLLLGRGILRRGLRVRAALPILIGILQITYLATTLVRTQRGWDQDPVSYVYTVMWNSAMVETGVKNAYTRPEYLAFIHEQVSQSLLTRVFGFGPGFSASNRFNPRSVTEDLLPGSTGAGSMFSTYLLETGYLGASLILILHVSVAVAVWRRRDRGLLSNAYLDAAAVAAFLLIPLAGYNSGWGAPPIAYSVLPVLGLILRKAPARSWQATRSPFRPLA
jgi:hypothetical protein